MSDEDLETSQVEDSEEPTTRVLTAEYKNGQLEIVDVSPYEKRIKGQALAAHMQAEGSDNSNDELKYMQVLDSDKNVVVDLLNLTLVRCEDGQEAYQLISTDAESGDDTAVACVLANDDDEQGSSCEKYVVLEGERGPVVLLQAPLSEPARAPSPVNTETKPKLTPAEILEKAKAFQKTKALLAPQKGRPRKRKGELPPPHELLSLPQFKLFLYSCKMCHFKCNAIKELTAHKAAQHAGGARWRGGSRAAGSALQCARCPYRAPAHSQLMKHVKDKHTETTTVGTATSTELLLDSAEVRAADVLVCGACGFESGQRQVFRRHIEQEHSVTPC